MTFVVVCWLGLWDRDGESTQSLVVRGELLFIKGTFHTCYCRNRTVRDGFCIMYVKYTSIRVLTVFTDDTVPGSKLLSHWSDLQLLLAD